MSHPIHPLLVHFPIACWSMGTMGDVVGLLSDYNFAESIGVLISIGCISAIVAMAVGLYESSNLEKTDRLTNAVDHHMYAAVTAWSFYSFSLLLRWKNGVFVEPNMFAIIFSGLGLISLIITGWHGANLIYKHGVGVNLLEKK